MKGVLTKELEEADLVVFTGGEDVTPDLYHEKKHPRTWSNIVRDQSEAREFFKAKNLGKKMIGICRGSQLLCVLSGGKLVQHQDNPLHVHSIETIEGKTIEITSSHHQAQYPYLMAADEYKILAWTKGISPFHQDGNGKELKLYENKEAEIVYYPKTKCLGIQGHPEWMVNKEEYNKSFEYLDTLLEDFMEDKL